MSDENIVTQEWSFEAMWTWSGSGPSGTQEISVGPTVPPTQNVISSPTIPVVSPTVDSRCGVFQDSGGTGTAKTTFVDPATGLKMEYSWQSLSGSSVPGSAPHSRRPQSFHQTDKLSNVEGDPHYTLYDPSTRPRVKPKGTNGKWTPTQHVWDPDPEHFDNSFHRSKRVDSGYASSEQPSPMQPKLHPPGTNGRCKSSYNITLENNSASSWAPVPETRAVFHGPTCECIVCHDMEVRFESIPPPPSARYRMTSSLPSSPATLLQSSKSTDVCNLKETRPQSPELPAKMYRSHFCTHVSGRSAQPHSSIRKSVPQCSTSSVPGKPSIGDESQIEKSMQRLSVNKDDKKKVYPKETFVNVERTDPLNSSEIPVQPDWRTYSASSQPIHFQHGEAEKWKRESASNLGSTSRIKDVKRPHQYRYSYPSSNLSSPISVTTTSRARPHVIHIDVYCQEDEEDEETGAHRDPPSNPPRWEWLPREFPVTEEGHSFRSPRATMEFSQTTSGDNTFTDVTESSSGVNSSSQQTRNIAGHNRPTQISSDCFPAVTPSSRRAGVGHHSGPTRNKNCACEYCQRYFSGVTSSSVPSVPSMISGSTSGLGSQSHSTKQ